jgi:hypothetical protein
MKELSVARDVNSGENLDSSGEEEEEDNVLQGACGDEVEAAAVRRSGRARKQTKKFGVDAEEPMMSKFGVWHFIIN